MKIMPALTEVKRIASDTKYNVLPVSLELLSDFTTPIETIRILKNVSTHCYMPLTDVEVGYNKAVMELKQLAERSKKKSTAGRSKAPGTSHAKRQLGFGKSAQKRRYSFICECKFPTVRSSAQLLSS